MKDRRSVYLNPVFLSMVFTVVVLGIMTYRHFRQERLDIALATGVIRGNYRDVIVFLKQGANPDTSVNTNETAIGSDNFFRVLRNHFSPGSHDKSETPLLIEAICRAEDDPAIVGALVAAGANVNTQGKDGETPLSLVAQDNRTTILKILLSKGADANMTDKHAWTPLMKAIDSAPYKGNSAVVKALLAHGAYVNAKNDNGETALILAAERKSDTVRLLIDHGADMNIEDRNGHTALSVAKWAGASEIIILLEQKGSKQ